MKQFSDSVLKNVPRETLDRLTVYKNTLDQWRAHINLVGNSTDIWERHIEESAQLFSLISPNALSLIDLGTGAGFPGMVLAILGIKNVHLVDSDRKKIIFLREITRLTQTEVTLHQSRIEDLPVMTFDVITSRALAPLETLLRYAKPLMGEGAFCLFPKGKNYSIEMEQARQSWTFDCEVHPASHDGAILAIRNIQNQ